MTAPDTMAADERAAARTRVRRATLDAERVLQPVLDARPSGRYYMWCDRRAQQLLVRDEGSGGVSAVVPGGVRLLDRPDQLDMSLLWRHAYWSRLKDLVDDMPPSFVLDLGLVEAVRRHPDHAWWMLEQGGCQLAGLMGCMGTRDDPKVQHLDRAWRRALYVYLDVEAAASDFAARTGEAVPEQTRAALLAARDRIDGPTIAGIALLNNSAGDVALRLRRFGLPIGLRWQGKAIRLMIVFVKLFEAERAIESGHPPEQICERLRYLRGALDLAKYDHRRGRALKRLERICSGALTTQSDGQWSSHIERDLQQALVREATVLAEAVRALALKPTANRAARSALLHPEFEVVPV